MKKGVLNAIDAARGESMPDANEAEWERYAHLLEHCDEGRPAEVQELATLIRKCRRLPADVCHDELVIREHKTCDQCFRDARGIGGKIAAAQAAIEQHERDTARLIEELKQNRQVERDAIQGEIDRLNNQRAEAKAAAAKIRDLKVGRRVLAHVPDPDLKDLE